MFVSTREGNAFELETEKLAYLRCLLEDLYETYNRRELVRLDPVKFLYGFEDQNDREIVALVASSLSYGRVEQINRSVSLALERLGRSPARLLSESTTADIKKALSGFKHRFTTGEDLALLLTGMKRVMEKWGTLERCFKSGIHGDDETVLTAICRLTKVFWESAGCSGNYLLPSPEGGSACKRINLFLRWLVRSDGVDPGCWDGVSSSRLLVPLDTHMHRICTSLGFTRRKQADIRTALEVTSVFREIAPLDPVRYDFTLTRIGMNGEEARRMGGAFALAAS